VAAIDSAIILNTLEYLDITGKRLWYGRHFVIAGALLPFA
jgi:hypothetical protein